MVMTDRQNISLPIPLLLCHIDADLVYSTMGQAHGTTWYIFVCFNNVAVCVFHVVEAWN